MGQIERKRISETVARVLCLRARTVLSTDVLNSAQKWCSHHIMRSMAITIDHRFMEILYIITVAASAIQKVRQIETYASRKQKTTALFPFGDYRRYYDVHGSSMIYLWSIRRCQMDLGVGLMIQCLHFYLLTSSEQRFTAIVAMYDTVGPRVIQAYEIRNRL